MKLVLKLALLAFPAVALAQPGPPPSVKNVAADPTGNACSNGAPIEWYAGTYYGCDNTGHYAALGGGRHRGRLGAGNRMAGNRKQSARGTACRRAGTGRTGWGDLNAADDR